MRSVGDVWELDINAYGDMIFKESSVLRGEHVAIIWCISEKKLHYALNDRLP